MVTRTPEALLLWFIGFVSIPVCVFPGSNRAGCRTIKFELAWQHGLIVPRTLVACILHALDPDAVRRRRMHRLERRRYISPGPLHAVHVDGYGCNSLRVDVCQFRSTVFFLAF